MCGTAGTGSTRDIAASCGKVLEQSAGGLPAELATPRGIDNSRQRTRQWHFVDIELATPNFDAACFNHPPIPSGKPASNGPADDCVADKVQEFAGELANPATDLEEQVVALKFLLHFVGDLHQPLHDSDDHDRGGNDKRVSAAGLRAGNLHHYWDTEFVDQLGPDAKTIASDLIGPSPKLKSRVGK